VIRRSRTNRGTTLVEVLISSALAVLLLGGATMLLQSTQTLADSSDRMNAAQMRSDRALWPLVDDMRRGSMASVATTGGATFSDGTADSGISLQRVEGFEGDILRGTTIDYRWVVPGGATEGSLVRTQDGVDRTLARRVEAFSITRAGELFTVSITTVSGPNDDRARRSNASIAVTPRNP
jgi:type II secretory pathway component PulJ